MRKNDLGQFEMVKLSSDEPILPSVNYRLCKIHAFSSITAVKSQTGFAVLKFKAYQL